MITQQTAAEIWTAHREIAAGEQLLAEMAEAGEREVEILYIETSAE